MTAANYLHCNSWYLMLWTQLFSFSCSHFSFAFSANGCLELMSSFWSASPSPYEVFLFSLGTARCIVCHFIVKDHLGPDLAPTEVNGSFTFDLRRSRIGSSFTSKQQVVTEHLSEALAQQPSLCYLTSSFPPPSKV